MERGASGLESFMSAVEPGREKLREAIERLRNDIDRVEFWATRWRPPPLTSVPSTVTQAH